MRALANQFRSLHTTTNRRKGHRELDSFPVAHGPLVLQRIPDSRH